MILARRRFLQLAAIAALPGWPSMSHAQTYPSKPVRFMIGFPAGGPNDILGRIVAQWLSAKARPAVQCREQGRPFRQHRDRGGRARAGRRLHRAAVRPSNAISGSLYPNLSFNFLRDIVPVAGVTREALVMVVHPSVPAKTVPEFLAYAKANRRQDQDGLDRQRQLAARHRGTVQADDRARPAEVVHYGGGGPALKAMIAGEAQMMFEPMSASIGPVRSGQLRALAVTTTERSAALPEVPPMRDFVPGYEASAVTGIGVPKGTPAEIVELLNASGAAARSPTRR